MTLADLPQTLFLGVVFFALPVLTWRSRRSLPLLLDLPRAPIYAQVVILQLVLAIFAVWAVGPGRPALAELLISRPSLIHLGFAALLSAVALMMMAAAWNHAAPERRLFIEAVAPRTGRDHIYWIGVALVVGFSEEVVYRGALPAILVAFGASGWPVLVISSVAFAAAHLMQGPAAAFVAGGFGLVLHLLVIWSGSLLPAIAVHVVYDAVAGLWVASRLRRQSGKPNDDDLV